MQQIHGFTHSVLTFTHNDHRIYYTIKGGTLEYTWRIDGIYWIVQCCLMLSSIMLLVAPSSLCVVHHVVCPGRCLASSVVSSIMSCHLSSCVVCRVICGAGHVLVVTLVVALFVALVVCSRRLVGMGKRQIKNKLALVVCSCCLVGKG